ncbi:MAG: ATP-binding protein [Acidobacteriota bacterium]|nr:ATP-binding protein [Acidobacteriota bacterium]
MTTVAVIFLGVLVLWTGIMLRERLVRIPLRALERSDEGFRDLFEKSPLGMNMWELKGTGTKCNQAFLDLLGYSAEEYDLISYETLNATDSTEQDREVLKQLIDKGSFGPHYKEYLHKQGHVVPVAVYGMVVTASDGTKRIWSIIEDLTERRRMERVIREAQERLNLALQSGQIGTWELDLESEELTWDSYMPILFGLEEGDYSSSRDVFLERVHPDDLIRIAAGVENARKHGHYEAEYRITHGDGEAHTLKSKAHVFHAGQDKSPRLIGTTWDITAERNAAETLIAAKEAAEQASRAKAEFLATMSHEIRTPLNGIMGMTELLLNSNLPQRQHDHAKTILKCGKDLLGIINDILDFSQIETGRLEFEILPFDLADLCRQVIEITRETLKSKPVTLHLHIADDIPNPILGDPGRLRQILNSMMDNAAKFTRDGEIALSVDMIEETRESLMLRFDVRDTGIGIEQEALSTLFQPFTQVDSSSTRHYSGTGLGLAICKCLVEGLNGRIWVDSVPGEGSTFHFTARLQKNLVTLPEGETASSAPAAVKGAVLLVMADPTERRTLADLMRQWSIHVDTCPDAIEALNILRSEQKIYDTVIIHQGLTQISGLDLARILVSDPRLGSTKLVMLGETAHQEDLNHASQLGVEKILIEPYSQEQLRDALQWNLPALNKISLSDSEAAAVQEDGGNELPPAPEGGWRVLVVDFHPPGRRGVMRKLANLGIEPDMAASGMEALAYLKIRAYHMVLIECSLPDMDGMATSDAIRRLEAEGSLAGDCCLIAMCGSFDTNLRERCLKAGMDDLLRRPIDSGELQRMMYKWLSLKTTGAQARSR